MQMKIFILFIYFSTHFITIDGDSVVIRVDGDCRTVGHSIAQNHGFRIIRQIFDGYCEIEADPSSVNYHRHRRSIEQGVDPAHLLSSDQRIQWAETQQAKVRTKREILFNDPEWNNMWYLERHLVRPELPDLNVTGAWKLGYTGRGHVVTFLDDGLEFDHPDLSENYDKEASTDINGNDDDPSPRYDPSNENKHGTRCAGEVAAKADNKICGVGVAYHARVGGIRMLDGDVTDSVEARSISHRPDHVDIYSASWGPDDNGLVVDGPGQLAKKAFEDGVKNGRNGKGSIFVWASGNGGRAFDSCACDGYINSIYTIAISSVTESGNKPWYLEECAGTLASAYSSGSGGTEHGIISTDLRHGCTSQHSGTSAAAPLAAAIYALVLEANTNLTWRDIMHITVLGSRPLAISSNNDYITNAAGFKVSSKFGFGLMDAGLMTWLAARWVNVPSMSTCRSSKIIPQIQVDANSEKSFSFDMNQCMASEESKEEVNYIEQVQIIVTMTAQRRGDIELFVVSPFNTTTQILPKRANDASNVGFQEWSFLTVQLWGESPHGSWKIRVVNNGQGTANLISYEIVVHGTREKPIKTRSSSASDVSACHFECNANEPCGLEDTNCTSCRHYKQPLSDNKFRCVALCPEGTFSSTEEKLCRSCHARCKACRNETENSCVTCPPSLLLISEQMKCVDVCPPSFYTDRQLRKCVPCISTCAQCEEAPDRCSLCSEGFSFKDKACVKSEKVCKPDEYFDFSKDLCRWCDSRCETCSGPNAYQCRSCDRNSKYPHLQITSCVSICSGGFFLDQSSSKCLPCHESCFNCTSTDEKDCFDCKLGFVYVPEKHRCERNQGKPVYHDPKTGESLLCHSSCSQCKGPRPTDCLTCNPENSVLLDDGHCVHSCPEGYYQEKSVVQAVDTNVCRRCSSSCKSCYDANVCIDCYESKGFQHEDGRCVPRCSKGSYPLEDRCESCVAPCSDCVNATVCRACNPLRYLHNDHCLDTCPDGYFSNVDRCSKCNPVCRTCNGPSESDCLTCVEGFRYDKDNEECLNNCANGNYFDPVDKICRLCQSNCLECVYPGSTCRQCNFPRALNTVTYQCLSCCTSNQTTSDCCQCPSIWDGFCLHELSKPSDDQSRTWWATPLNVIRDRFSQLDRSRQKNVLIVLIVILCVLGILVVGLALAFVRFHWINRRKMGKFNMEEYSMINQLNADDDDDDDDH